MTLKQKSDLSAWGFISPDGKYQSISSATANLEYASKSVEELQQMISDYITAEEYEKCAVIRDEIVSRTRRN